MAFAPHAPGIGANSDQYTVTVEEEASFGAGPTGGSFAAADILPVISFEVSQLGRKIIELDYVRDKYFEEKNIFAAKAPVDFTFRIPAYGFSPVVPTGVPVVNTLSKVLCSVLNGGNLGVTGTNPETPASQAVGGCEATNSALDVGGVIGLYKAATGWDKTLLYSNDGGGTPDALLWAPEASAGFTSYDELHGGINFWPWRDKDNASNLLSGASLSFGCVWNDDNQNHGFQFNGCRGANLVITWEFGELVMLEFTFRAREMEKLTGSDPITNIGYFAETGTDEPYPEPVGDDGYSYCFLAKEDVANPHSVDASTNSVLLPIMKATLDLGGSLSDVMGFGKTAGISDFRQKEFKPRLTLTVPAGCDIRISDDSVDPGTLETITEIVDSESKFRIGISTGDAPGNGFDVWMKNAAVDADTTPGEEGDIATEEVTFKPTKYSDDVDAVVSADTYGLNADTPLDASLVIAQL